MMMFILVLFPFIVHADGTSRYSDVSPEDSHYPAIMKLTDIGVINGKGDGTFGYKEKLIRRHGAVLFYEALKNTNAKEIQANTSEEIQAVLNKYYEDVDMDSMYAKQIAGVTPGVFKGNHGVFGPTDKLTRQQMATTIVKAFDLQDNGTNPGINLKNVYKDHKVNVKILAQYGITNQLDDFRPGETITRGQFATFLYKTMTSLDLIEEYGTVPDDNNTVPNAHKTTNYDINFSDVMNRQMQKTPKVDGAGQFLASEELVKYYANPANFEKGTSAYYQFLVLSGTSGLSAEEINNKILAGKGSLEGTADAFIEAAKKYSINELYLIAHALHETGNGTSALASGYPVSKVDGKEVTEKTTYNVFGIRAFDSCPIKCGSEHAYKEGWFTPEEAIIGGAAFINNGYIGQGQDTLYKMKWNPRDPGDHQYATHVMWAVIQAKNLENMFENDDLHKNVALQFEVPKYKNQPSASRKPTGEAAYQIDHTLRGALGKTSTSDLRIRKAPYETIITTLSKGTKLEVIGENGGWYKVKTANQTGWVSGKYVDFTNLLQTIKIDTSLNVRVKPEGTVVGSLGNKEVVFGVLNDEGNLVKDGDWYKIIYNGEPAWVHGDFIKEL
ncbi:SH3 domain-containing protein [Salinibacillus aidingensis]